MPTFTIDAPDGKSYSIEGANAEGALAALKKHIGGTVAEKPAPMSAGDVAGDVAKSGGIGAAKGAIGTVGALGDLRDAASAGLDWAGDKLGIDPATVKNAASKIGDVVAPGFSLVAKNAPTSQQIQSTIEGATGEFYKPKTTAGEYAQTAGEFLPAMIGGPESLGVRALTRVAIPAVASETAGQATKGTAAEPWARMAAALLSPAVTSTARRIATPFPATAERTALADALRGEGVGLTAGQATGNKPLQWMESALGDIPGSGGTAARMQTNQAEQFTSAALRRAGIDAQRATPEVIDNAFHRIGADFDGLAARNNLHMDRQFATDLTDTVREYNSLVPQSMRSPVVENVVNDLAANAGQNHGVITGEAYQASRSRLDRAARSSARDPQLSEALRGLRNSLDDAMERTIGTTNPADLDAWRNARNEYRNMLVLEKSATGAGSQTAEGLISPSSLRNATVSTHGRRNYARGNGDFADLSRAGEAIMKPLPNSGTAPRLYAQHLASLLSSGVGGALAGIPGLVGGAATPAVVGRALMSRPVQQYLSNQAFLPRQGGGAAQRALAAALSVQSHQSLPERQP